MVPANPRLTKINIEKTIEELNREREEGKSHFACYLKALDIFNDLCNGNPEEKEVDYGVIKSISEETAFSLRMELECFVDSLIDGNIKGKWKDLVKRLKELHSPC